MTPTFKAKIIRDFNRNAATYDNHAILQRKVADNLFAKIMDWDFKTMKNPSNSISAIPKPCILDIGCGTGYFHELLRKNKIYLPLVQTDISLAMCKTAATYASPPEYGSTYTYVSDMHKLPFADNSFANILSSMTLQWAEDKNQIFAEIKRVLHDKGNFAISLVGENSLEQLGQAFSLAGYTPPIHKFASLEETTSAVKTAGLSLKEIHSQTITLEYPDIYALIHSIKEVGASYKGIRDGGLKGKNYFAKIEKAYKQLVANQENLPLSWNIIYVCGTK